MNISVYSVPNNFASINFGAMKKSEFDSTDLVAVNKFKAPISNFNSNEDLQDWCNTKIENEYLTKKYNARKNDATEQRQELLKEWFDYFSKNNQTNQALALLIIDGITSDLKNNTDAIPPTFNADVLQSTITEITENSKQQRNYQVDFNKIYRNNLQQYYLSTNREKVRNYTGWVVVPSMRKDEKNFFDNVKKVQALSHPKWCTSTIDAKLYLMFGDFHIYFDNGKPELGVRFQKDVIKEIQGKYNDHNIPVKYLYEAIDHTKNYKTNELVKIALNKSEKKVRHFMDRLDCSLNDANTEQLLSAAKIKHRRDENDGLLIIDTYHQPSNDLKWDDIGIDENELFKDIKEIEGDADFSYSKVTNLGNLRKIGGSAYFEESKLKSLCELQEIQGDLNIKWSKIKDIGNCKVNGNIRK